MPQLQRGILETVAGAVLPGWINDLVSNAPKQADAIGAQAKGRGERATSNASAESDHAGIAVRSSTDEAARAGERTSEQHKQLADKDISAAQAKSSADYSSTQHAAGLIGAIGSSAGPLLNPAGAVVTIPAVQSGVERAVSSVKSIPGAAAGLAGEIKSAATDGLKAGATGWNCDQSEIMAKVGGVGKAITNAAVAAGTTALGPERFAQLQTFVQAQMTNIKVVAARIKKTVGDIQKNIEDLWTTKIVPMIKKAESQLAEIGKWWEATRRRISEAVGSAVKRAERACQGIKTRVIDPVVAMAKAAKERVAGLLSKAKGVLGSWWSKLPGWAKSGIMGMGAVVVGPIALVLAGAYKTAELLVKQKDEILNWAKKKVDTVLPTLAKGYNWVKQKAGAQIKRLKDLATRAAQVVRQKAAAAYRALDGATGGKLSALGAGLQALKAKISGTVCTALGDAAGPCINKFVPDIGPNAKDGESSDVTLTSTVGATVPVYDVPVKVAEGSTIKLSRKDKKYTMVQQGDASIAVTTPAAGGQDGVTGSVALPGSMGDAWKALTGKSGPSGTLSTPSAGTTAAKTSTAGQGGPGPSATSNQAAPGSAPTSGTQAAPAPAPAGPSAASGGATTTVGAEAGYKGSVSMTYVFDAGKDSTCDGLGGMTAMLAAQGLSHLLPPPVGNVLSTVTEGSYAENVTACKFSLAEYGSATVDVKKDGIGGIKAAVSGQAGVAVESSKDDAGDWTDSVTLSAQLGASGALSLSLAGSKPLDMSAAGDVTGTLSLKLAHSRAKDTITALNAGAQVAGSLALSAPAVLKVLPPSISDPVLAAMDPYLKAATTGKLGLTASISLENLQELGAKLDGYMATPQNVNTDGALSIVRTHLSTAANIKKKVLVTMSTSDSLGSATLGVNSEGVSGNASVGLARNTTKVLYSG